MKKPVLFAAIREEQDEKLRLISFLTKRSKADITREAIDLYIEERGDEIIKKFK